MDSIMDLKELKEKLGYMHITEIIDSIKFDIKLIAQSDAEKNSIDQINNIINGTEENFDDVKKELTNSESKMLDTVDYICNNHKQFDAYQKFTNISYDDFEIYKKALYNSLVNETTEKFYNVFSHIKDKETIIKSMDTYMEGKGYGITFGSEKAYQKQIEIANIPKFISEIPNEIISSQNQSKIESFNLGLELGFVKGWNNYVKSAYQALKNLSPTLNDLDETEEIIPYEEIMPEETSIEEIIPEETIVGTTWIVPSEEVPEEIKVPITIEYEINAEENHHYRR